MLENEFTAKGFLVWGICALYFLYEFFLRTVIGTYQHMIMSDFSLTSFQFSLLSSTLFLIIYGVMQVPVGIIVDKYGLKKSLLIGLLSCVLSVTMFAFSYSYALAIISRFLMGFGASFSFICVLVAVHNWMPHKYSAIFIGLSQFIGTMGPILAAGPLESLYTKTHLHWRSLFIYLAVFGIFLMVCTYFFVENHQQKTGKYVTLYKAQPIIISLKRLFLRLGPWYIALFSANIYFAIEYLSENEGRAFLVLKNISMNSASYMLTIAWIGYALGCPVVGFLSDLLERRKVMMELCALLALVAIIMVLYTSNKFYLQLGFFMLGLGAAGQSIGFATIAELFKKQFVAVGFGLNNAMIMLLSAISAPLMGWLLDAKQGLSPTLAISDYLSVFNILIGMAVIALVMALFFIKETFCKSQVEFTVLSVR